jgi:hypothetical protein
MKRFTYDVLNRDKLCYEEWYDEQDRVSYVKDHRAVPVLEIFYAHDELGNLVEDRTLSNGSETEKTRNTFNSKGDLVEQILYYNGSVYEKTTWEFSDAGFTRRRFDETGMEMERMVVLEQGQDTTHRFFLDGELVEIQTVKINSGTGIVTTKSMDAQNFPISHHREYFNADNRLTRSESLDELGIIETERTFEYEGDKLISHTEHDYVNNLGARCVYTYDTAGNQVAEHVYHQAGRLLEWKENTFDSQKRITTEKGFSNMFVNSRYIEYYHDKEFHFRHEYQG